MSDENPSMEIDRDELREKLAALEHRQWMYWAENLADREELPTHLIDRWDENMVPYDELDEETKEHDRKWARKVISLLERERVFE